MIESAIQGIKDHVLRRRLWPMILGLTDQNKPMDWTNLEDLYNQYSSQWKSILPDQETRFTAYRERKSIIGKDFIGLEIMISLKLDRMFIISVSLRTERDVIRCDRNHPFYKEQENLEKLQNLLLTYVMYDFDTGYVQGIFSFTDNYSNPQIHPMFTDVLYPIKQACLIWLPQSFMSTREM